MPTPERKGVIARHTCTRSAESTKSASVILPGVIKTETRAPVSLILREWIHSSEEWMNIESLISDHRPRSHFLFFAFPPRLALESRSPWTREEPVWVWRAFRALYPTSGTSRLNQSRGVPVTEESIADKATTGWACGVLNARNKARVFVFPAPRDFERFGTFSTCSPFGFSRRPSQATQQSN